MTPFVWHITGGNRYPANVNLLMEWKSVGLGKHPQRDMMSMGDIGQGVAALECHPFRATLCCAVADDRCGSLDSRRAGREQGAE